MLHQDTDERSDALRVYIQHQRTASPPKTTNLHNFVVESGGGDSVTSPPVKARELIADGPATGACNSRAMGSSPTLASKQIMQCEALECQTFIDKQQAVAVLSTHDDARNVRQSKLPLR